MLQKSDKNNLLVVHLHLPLLCGCERHGCSMQKTKQDVTPVFVRIEFQPCALLVVTMHPESQIYFNLDCIYLSLSHGSLFIRSSILLWKQCQIHAHINKTKDSRQFPFPIYFFYFRAVLSWVIVDGGLMKSCSPSFLQCSILS